jgi:glycine/D-amino acid oxidase-like deaminating enzyme
LGQKVCVIDDGHRSASSKVAAGLINPLAGMRFNRRPEIPDWLASAENWYQRLAQNLGRRLLHPAPMLRLYRSDRQQRFYQRRCDDPASRGLGLLGDEFTPEACPEAIIAEHGGFIQHRTGYVDMPALLELLGQWLRSIDALVSRDVTHDQVVATATGVRVGDLSANRLVFCDGARLRDNAWFDWLPLAPDKGEIIDIDDTWQPRHIINGAFWLVPLANGNLRFGSTHDHDATDDLPTAAGLARLLDGYRGLRPASTEVVVRRHLAGIRPATADRYPLLGRHPQQGALWVFNGFGARGALSIPWYAQRMAEHLVHGRPLPTEADIQRLCAPA